MNRKGKLVTILCVLMGILLSVGGAFFYFKKSNPKTELVATNAQVEKIEEDNGKRIEDIRAIARYLSMYQVDEKSDFLKELPISSEKPINLDDLNNPLYSIPGIKEALQGSEFSLRDPKPENYHYTYENNDGVYFIISCVELDPHDEKKVVAHNQFTRYSQERIEVK